MGVGGAYSQASSSRGDRPDEDKDRGALVLPIPNFITNIQEAQTKNFIGLLAWVTWFYFKGRAPLKEWSRHKTSVIIEDL
jgi:hypothetical protein